ncbi:hypothetical protein GF324_07410, partial [bacterium]|nr:hypothetical protein [bacterium]
LQDIHEDPNGNLILLARSKLLSFNPRNGHLKTLKSIEYDQTGDQDLVASPDGTLWFSFNQQLMSWDGFKLDVEPLGSNIARHALITRALADGSLLFGSWVGVFLLKQDSAYRYDHEGIAYWSDEQSKWIFTLRKQPGIVDYIAAMDAALGPDSAVWVGTFSEGVVRIEDDSLRSWQDQEGIPTGLPVSRVFFDTNDSLFVSNTRSIYRMEDDQFRPVKLNLPEGIEIQNFYKSSSGGWNVLARNAIVLQSRERQLILDGNFGLRGSRFLEYGILPDGSILARQSNSLVHFHPDSLFPDHGPVDLPVQIGSLWADNRKHPVNGKVKLPTGVREFRIEYYLPMYFNEERNQYRYRLVGLEDEFSPYSSEATTTYERLDPGEYRFELEAISATGQPSRPAEPLVIEIPPYFYETFAFQVLMALAGVGFIFGIAWLRVRQIQRQNEQLELTVQERTAELREALAQLERSHKYELEAERLNTARKMAASVAHEFNNPLAIMQGVYNLNEERLETLDSEKLKKDLRKIPRMTQRMHDLVDKLLNITELRELDYAGGMQIIDIEKSSRSESTNGEAYPGEDSARSTEP